MTAMDVFVLMLLLLVQVPCRLCTMTEIPTSSKTLDDLALDDLALNDARYSDKPLVYTQSGTIRGIRRTVSGVKVETFLGIPFAKPPTGELRFKKPVKVDAWNDILDANKQPNSCEQPKLNTFPGFVGESQWNANTEISEDCLYLNVWVPEWGRDESRLNPQMDVMIWIYGGSYTGGTITLEVYDGSYLAALNKVIVVSMNYRTGAFGFLFMDDISAPGNMALHDQNLALKWVKDNIMEFGGNPNSVTLFGESAGAASVSAHILSPISRGLFQRAILQSGSINVPWSLMLPTKSLRTAYKLADLVGCSTNILKTKDAVIQCLRSIPATAIIEAQDKLYRPIVGFPFVPTVDGEFLPENPLEIIRKEAFNKNVSLLIGTVLNEGSYFVLYDFLEYLDKDMPSLLTRNQASNIINTTFGHRTEAERELIHFMYTDWQLPWDGTKNRDHMMAMVGDYFFTCPINAFAQLMANRDVEVYYYLFGHRSSNNPWGKWMGVLHGDEVEYVFGRPLNQKLGFTPEESQLSSRIMKHLVTFARTGNPSTKDTEWPLYTNSNPTYVHLDTKSYRTGIGPRNTECTFWNKIYTKIQTEISSCNDPNPTNAAQNKLKSWETTLYLVIILVFFKVIINII